MKKLFVAMLTVFWAAALCIGAAADIAYEPSDNFYEAHHDECQYESRIYFSNGPEGYVIAYTSPQGRAAAVLPNGNWYNVSWTYGDGGERWGCIEYDPNTLENWGDKSAWVKMDKMTADYDSDCFFEDHRDEISAGDDSLSFTAGQTVYGWKYPGSGIVRFTLDGNSVRGSLGFSDTYTDSSGREWGYIGYYHGYRNFWVCLSEPFNGELAADENYVTPDLVPTASQARMNAALKEAGAGNYRIAAGAVGIAAIAAAVLVYTLLKKRQKSK